MGIENCQIRFDNENATYHPGQIVSGKIEFTLNSMKNIKGISVSFKGEAHVHWSESETYRDSEGKSKTRSVPYNGNEEYFSTKYYIIGGGNHDSIQIPGGRHVYPFTTTLPNILPSSFEGEKGYIRYTVKVTLDIPWKFDKTIKAAFTVISHLDCNTDERAKRPATLTMEKFLCCLCCREGPITGVLKLPFTGYVSGQSIPYTIEIDNASKTVVEVIKLKFKKIVSFHSQSPSKTRRSSVTIKEIAVGQRVNGQDSKTFANSFTVPSLPPSNLQYCRIIDLEYELKVIVEIEGFHSDMTGKVPIIIGTIPLRSVVVPPTSAPEQNISLPNTESGLNRPLLGWAAGPSMPTASMNPEIPPPSYEECQFGTSSILDKSDSEFTKFNKDKSYAPCYPVYNFNVMPMPQIPPPAGMPFMPMPVSLPVNVPSAPPS